MNNVIVIPVYKKHPYVYELFSLKACFDQFCNHEIIFVAPEGLDLSSYQVHINSKIKVERFDLSYFKGISDYNRLMLSSMFYQRFSDFDFMLIYQLDCFVFKDELNKWACSGYDYIGAPWLLFNVDNFSLADSFNFWRKSLFTRVMGNYNKMHLNLKVGNGGFSLRKVSKFILEARILKANISNKFMSNDSNALFNEDVYWSLFCKGLKKPDYKTGCLFALESFPEIGLKHNNGNLPFGCHAWPKHFEFWKNYIEFQGDFHSMNK